MLHPYRLLPVKVRHLDSDGKIDREAIITKIRVSDLPLLKEEAIGVTHLHELSENTTLSKVCDW
jgi:hypothetical protein